MMEEVKNLDKAALEVGSQGSQKGQARTCALLAKVLLELLQRAAHPGLCPLLGAPHFCVHWWPDVGKAHLHRQY